MWHDNVIDKTPLLQVLNSKVLLSLDFYICVHVCGCDQVLLWLTWLNVCGT
jgi:hypothetical protein